MPKKATTTPKQEQRTANETQPPDVQNTAITQDWEECIDGPRELQDELQTSAATSAPVVAEVPLPAIQPANPVRRKPRIVLPCEFVTIDESAELLFPHIERAKLLYFRSGKLVELITPRNTPEISILDAVAAQSRFEQYATFISEERDENKVTQLREKISKQQAEQYIKCEPCRDILPKLQAVVNCSLLVENEGRLHRVNQGYDSITELYVASNSQPETVDLQEAVRTLSGLLRDFDFISPGDKSRALASLITPALKLGNFIKGSIPIDVAEANDSQSGKTYRQKIVAAIYNQTLAVVTNKNGGVGSPDESFSSHLVKGRPFIQFDNVRGKFDSQHLEAFLTAGGSFSARVPYAASVDIDPSKFILFLSSNGLDTTRDLINRSSIIRIRKQPEGYQYAECGGINMLEVVSEHQPLILGSVFSIVEEWFRGGKPKTTETRHSFREWCCSLDWIVQHIFGEAPLMDGHDEASARAANPHLSFLRNVAVLLDRQDQLGRGLTASNLAETCVTAELAIPDLSPAQQNTDQGPKTIGKIMGRLFGQGNTLPLENYRVSKSTTTEESQGGNPYSVSRYAFERVAAPIPAPVPTGALCP